MVCSVTNEQKQQYQRASLEFEKQRFDNIMVRQAAKCCLPKDFTTKGGSYVRLGNTCFNQKCR